MTSPLRSRVVEAGARAIANDRADEIDEWHFDDARVALDAMLDCLTENQLEWFELAGWTDNAEDLIAVLRNPE